MHTTSFRSRQRSVGDGGLWLAPLLFLTALLAAAGPEHAKPEKSAKYKFSIVSPVGWDVVRKDDDGEPLRLALNSRDRTASVVVMTVQAEAGETAAAILAAMDRQRQAHNTLADSGRNLTKDRLKVIGADDGAAGTYTLAAVTQRAIAVMRGRRGYIVLAAFRSDVDEQTRAKVEESVASFRILK